MKEAMDIERIVSENGRRLRYYVMGLGVGHAQADDVVQEVFLGYWRNPGAKPDDVELVPWLKGMARNISMNHFRSERRMQARHREAIADMLDAGAGDEAEDLGAMLPRLRECIGELPERSRTIVEMKYKDGSHFKDIVEKLGMGSEAAARMAMMRIRTALKECLEGKRMR